MTVHRVLNARSLHSVNAMERPLTPSFVRTTNSLSSLRYLIAKRVGAIGPNHVVWHTINRAIHWRGNIFTTSRNAFRALDWIQSAVMAALLLSSPKKEVMFSGLSVCFFVCLFLCSQKMVNRFSFKFHRIGRKCLDFVGDSYITAVVSQLSAASWSKKWGQEVAFFPTDSCNISTEEFVRAQNFNFVPKIPPKRRISSRKCCIFEEHFRTKRKFSDKLNFRRVNTSRPAITTPTTLLCKQASA